MSDQPGTTDASGPQAREANGSRTDRCLNCDTKVVGRFCHACGQDNQRGRLVTMELLSGFFGSLLALDSRYLRTFAGLARAPGTVCREYVAGKRTRYSNPIAYFVAAVTLDLLMAATVSLLSRDGGAGDPFDISSSVAAPMGLVISLPMAAFCTWLFKDAGYNLAENYVFTLYLLGQLLIYETLLIPIPFPEIGDQWVALIVFVVLLALFVQSGCTFYGLRMRTLLGRLAASFAVVSTVLIIIVIVIELLAPGSFQEDHV